MKNLFLYCIMLLGSISSINAQFTDVVTISNEPVGLAINNNYLYISEDNGFANLHKISKIDLSQTNPIPSDVITNLPFLPLYTDFKGDSLLVIKNDYDSATHTIMILDITQPAMGFIDSIPLNAYPLDLEVKGDVIYLTEHTMPLSSGRIMKLDLSQANPSPTPIFTTSSSSPFLGALKLYGNDLYFIEPDIITQLAKVRKIDLTQSNPIPVDVVNGLMDPWSLEITGDDLYLTEQTTGNLFKADLTQNLPITNIDTIGSLGIIPKLLFDGTDLYITDDLNNKVVKLNIFPVSTHNQNLNASWSIRSNPVNSVLYLEGIESVQEYMIYDMLGRVLLTGIIEPNNNIPVSSLEGGIYVLKLKNQGSLKFIKN